MGTLIMATDYTVVTASQFDRDLHSISSDWSKYKGPAVRCGFEAEMASALWWSDFADKLQLALGINRSSIVVSERYGASHDGDYRYWSVESDTSIQVDPEHQCQIEVVSPILGIDAMLGSLEKVCSLMATKQSGKALAISNNSTGLHITFSLEDTNLTKVNVAKLYLLLGEDYWRLVFGRNDTSYAKSVKPALLAMVAELSRSSGMKSMQQFDLDKFYQEMRSDDIGRYGTINISNIVSQKDFPDKQRIEFRLPGGAGYEHKFSLLARVARRFAYALYASTCDAYDDVFALKLYKFLDKYKEATHEDDHRVKAIANTHGFSLVDFPANMDQSRVRLFSFIYTGSSLTHIEADNPAAGFSSEIESQIEALAEKYGGRSISLGSHEFSLKPEVLLTLDHGSSQRLAYGKYTETLLHLFGLTTSVQLSQFTMQALAENSNCTDILFSIISTMAVGPRGAAGCSYANLGFFLSQHGGDSDPYVIYNKDYFLDHPVYLDYFLAGFGVEPKDGISDSYLSALRGILQYGMIPSGITSSFVGKIAEAAFVASDSVDAKMLLSSLATKGYLVNASQASHAFVQEVLSDTAKVDALFMRRDVAEMNLGFIYGVINKLGFASEVRPALIQIIKDHGGWRASETFPRNALTLDLSNAELNEIGITNIPGINLHPDMHTINEILVGLKNQNYPRDSISAFFNGPDVLSYIKTEDFIDDDDFCIKLVSGWLANYENVHGSLVENEILHNAGIAFWFTSALHEFDKHLLSVLSWGDVDTIYTTVLHSSYANELFHKILSSSAASKELPAFMRAYLTYVSSASSGGITNGAMDAPPSIYVPLLNEAGVKILTAFFEKGFIFEPTFKALAMTVDAFVASSYITEIAPHCLLLDKVFSTYKSKSVDPTNENGFLTNRIESLRRAGFDVRDVAPIATKELQHETAPYVHEFSAPFQPSRGERRSVEDTISYIANPPFHKSDFFGAVEAMPAEDMPDLFVKIQSGAPVVKAMGFGLLTSASIYPMDDQGNRLIKPEVLLEGLKYPDFTTNLVLALVSDAKAETHSSSTTHRVYGYTWSDFFYLLLSPDTKLGPVTFDTKDYLVMLGYFAAFVNPSILLSERSLGFYKTLVNEIPGRYADPRTESSIKLLLHKFARGLVEFDPVNHVRVLDPNMPYPLLRYVAKNLSTTAYLHNFFENFCK